MQERILEELLASADARTLTEADLSSLAAQYASSSTPVHELLSDFAVFLTQRVLDRRLDFRAANAYLNWIMPVAGFEAAPPRFWEAYVAFEDFETVAEPGDEARTRLQELVAGWHAA